jgi:hypothetical protein
MQPNYVLTDHRYVKVILLFHSNPLAGFRAAFPVEFVADLIVSIS